MGAAALDALNWVYCRIGEDEEVNKKDRGGVAMDILMVDSEILKCVRNKGIGWMTGDQKRKKLTGGETRRAQGSS